MKTEGVKFCSHTFETSTTATPTNTTTITHYSTGATAAIVDITPKKDTSLGD
jgi:hypothetical protein